MHRLVATSLAAAGLGVGLTAAVSAADLGRPAPAPVYTKAPIMVAPTWTGCYAGIEGGGIWGKESVTDVPTGLPVTANLKPSGGLVGGTLGCNYQMSSFVVGVENDLSWAGLNASQQTIAPFNTANSHTLKTTWLDTLRARAGVAFGPGLYYVTGGAAFTDIDNSDINPAVTASIKSTVTGWTVGAGAEWMLPAAPRWSVKAEYLYVDFGSRNDNFQALGGPFLNTTSHLTENVGRVGVNYKFW
jgi:outer membrane immunogenic protein